jgi:HlyD family secretion protein
MSKFSVKQAIVPLALLLVLGAGLFLIWDEYQKTELPSTFASGNGRIEAREYDIASKQSGRVLQVLVSEGDMVEADQTLARMDTRDLQAELREADARLREASEGKKYANAIVTQHESELKYARLELERSQQLVKKGHVSREKVDQDITATQTAQAVLRAALVLVIKSEA